MRKIVSVFILAFILTSCKHKYNPPADFNFSLSFGVFRDQISTFDSTYRTDGELGPNRWGDTAVKVVFTKEEMKQVYQKMMENDYLDLPDTINSKVDRIPHTDYLLKVNANSIEKKIYTVEYLPYRLDSIVEKILKILYSKKEVKNLPPDKRIAL